MARSRVQRLGVLVTRSCNLTCDYCYQDRAVRSRLAWPLLRDRLRELLEPGLVEVRFSGGEPLLEYPLIQRTVMAARALEFGCVAFQWQLLTNGLLLDAARLEWLRSERFAIQLSLQVDPARPEAVERSLHALDTIAEGGGFLPGDAVTITVVPGSSGMLVRAVEEAVAVGAPEVSMSPDLRPGRTAIESEDQWFELLSSTASDLQPEAGPHPVSNFRTAGAEPGPCSAISPSNVTIDTDGSLWSCDALIGLAPQTALDDPVWRSSLRDRLSADGMFSTAADGPECGECPARASCRVCPATKVQMNGGGPGEFFCGFVRAVERVRAVVTS